MDENFVLDTSEINGVRIPLKAILSKLSPKPICVNRLSCQVSIFGNGHFRSAIFNFGAFRLNDGFTTFLKSILPQVN